MTTPRALLIALALTAVAVPLRAADPRDPLLRARTLYNEGQFDLAVAAAGEVRSVRGQADRADLVAARALLERYRQGQVADDLGTARERLAGIDPSRLPFSEQVEYIVGLGETLYFDQAAGAAAMIFESILVGPPDLALDARERLLDWWATALDRDAHARPDIERRDVYQRIRDRMAIELAEDVSSAPAVYWAAAAARAQGDLQAAWDAAEAGWARAPLMRDHGLSLRADLDDLVLKAIIPERARMLARPPDALLADWEQFKEKWRRAAPPSS